MLQGSIGRAEIVYTVMTNQCIRTTGHAVGAKEETGGDGLGTDCKNLYVLMRNLESIMKMRNR